MTRFARTDELRWEPWPEGAIPAPPVAQDAPFEPCGHYHNQGSCVQWRGVHFFAISFDTGELWVAGRGWLPAPYIVKEPV